MMQNRLLETLPHPARTLVRVWYSRIGPNDHIAPTNVLCCRLHRVAVASAVVLVAGKEEAVLPVKTAATPPSVLPEESVRQRERPPASWTVRE